MASADTVEPADAPAGDSPAADAEPVSSTELNAWRRGFTPQAEIWNGRLAMLGLSVGLTVLLIARLAAR
ncbi:high light inducible protein [Cyanobium sp. CH-040]|uniref:high light inducible protein n=1 Tax=Cyanobium sp. CH-040 TaxID=2823708 RepID=UPI0020CDA7A5|nr:high light inducible protein [Cyanobium sp. CH-040]